MSHELRSRAEAAPGLGRTPLANARKEKEALMKMTTEEAFVKVLQMHGVEHAFGIIGSAFMPISDLFSRAGITFWDVAHESNGGLICDGFTRSTGKIAMAIAQNGPGVTGFATAMKTAYWNHTPMLLVTPQASNRTIGLGGFQEVEQMALFRDIVGYQEEVRDPSRIAEVLNRVILKAKRLSAPAQINVPRDFWNQTIDIALPAIIDLERPAGGDEAVAEAAKLMSAARFPVILSGAGVILSGAIDDCVRLAERLDAPVCNNYQHNDSFPGSHRLAAGPLGYNGSKAAMELIARADVVLALGTRLNPFSTLPAYGLDYWPRGAKIIQVDMNADRIGLTKPITVGVCGDAKLVTRGIIGRLAPTAGDDGRDERRAITHDAKSKWLQMLSSIDHEDDDPGTVWNEEARRRDPDRMSPRQAWRAIQVGLPGEAIISTDIGNNCAIGNAYPKFDQGRKYLAPGLFGPCGYGFPAIIGAKIGNPDVPCVGFAGDGAFGISMNEMSSICRDQWPAITMVIFRNFQWGAEKRNAILWYDNNFVGTELDAKLSYAKVAEACGFRGVVVRSPSQLTEAIGQSCEDQQNRVTTFLEVILNQELGEPFRRDAMRKPAATAGIQREDMRRQNS
jgi:sulfoacetaldehyde acetyltransferase